MPRSTRVLLMILSLPVIAIIGIAVASSFEKFALVLKGREEAMTPLERGLLFKIKDLKGAAGVEVDPDGETFKKRRFFDDSYELIYECDVDDENVPYLSYEVRIQRNLDDANADYVVSSAFNKMGMRLLRDPVDFGGAQRDVGLG